MTIKVALLKSGEDVIADIKELISEDEKVVSYVFSNPYVVKLYRPEVLMEDNNDSVKKPYNISVYPWMPLTEDTDIVINPDWVVTIVEPAQKLKQTYELNTNGRGSIDTDNSSTSITESVEFNN